MIRRYLLALAVAVPLCGGCAASSKIVDPRSLTYPELKFTIPHSERTTLDNGIVVYLLEDHELPMVSITSYIRTGGIYEPAEMTGLAGIAGAMIRSGGTESLTPDALDAELEFMASGVESGISDENGSVSMSTLTKNLDRSLELFAEVLLHPRFDQQRLDLTKKNTIDAIRRQNDDPKGIAAREYRRALYENHPLGRMATIDSISRITRDDIIAFYKQSMNPAGIIIAVSGDFDSKAVTARLNRLVGQWRSTGQPFAKVGQPDGKPQQRVLKAQKQVSQSVVKMGHLGLEKSNPDQYAVRVMDYILGGGFTSRLMQEVRSNQGLAYHAGRRFDSGRGFPGTFTAETETKSASTAKAITLMKDIIAGMTKEKVRDEELRLAKDSIINSFIFGFTRADSIVSQQARLEYFDYPKGYLENFRDNIAKVTADDILRVSRKYLHPEALTIMVVGDETKYDQPLATFGAVREIKLENFNQPAGGERHGGHKH
ncbi:MAG: insulinase family protein [Geobacter sp.]|nr:insulinase family protein [Geobacter sp.]